MEYKEIPTTFDFINITLPVLDSVWAFRPVNFLLVLSLLSSKLLTILYGQYLDVPKRHLYC